VERPLRKRVRKLLEVKELNDFNEIEGSLSAASRRFIRDAKAASRNPTRDTKAVLRRGRVSANTEEDTRKLHGVSITLLVPFERSGNVLKRLGVEGLMSESLR
jgi:hypothetical protein